MSDKKQSNNPDYWQIACGSLGREYSREFLEYGIACVGGETQRKAMREVRAGDRVILKNGSSQIVAVGVVVERDGKVNGDRDKPWLRDFDGWDLSAYCHVNWHILESRLERRGLTRSTIERVHQNEIKELCDELIAQSPQKSDYRPEPREPDRVSDDEILSFLLRQGLRPSAADELATTLRRIRLLADYYYQDVNWEDVREHETRSFLIVPLLLALGWSEQQMKIELPTTGGGRIDVACFAKPYRRTKGHANESDCRLILESKGLSQGLSYAPAQGERYASTFPECRVMIVSNGICYKAFTKQAGSTAFSSDRPSAYLNLRDPRAMWPLYPEINGALDVLRLLLPNTWQ